MKNNNINKGPPTTTISKNILLKSGSWSPLNFTLIEKIGLKETLLFLWRS